MTTKRPGPVADSTESADPVQQQPSSRFARLSQGARSDPGRSPHLAHEAAEGAEFADLTSLPLFEPMEGSGGFGLEDSAPLRALIPEPGDVDLDGVDGVVDWQTLAQFREEASARLTARVERGGARSDAEREQLGIAVIVELIQNESEARISAGKTGWSPAEEADLKKTLYDAIFGLGRLQPLVDTESLENIIIIARGDSVRVWLEDSDGTLTEGPAVADSEEDLRNFLADLGSRQNRPFTQACPRLHLRLPGGARLAAASWVTASTSVVIRRHRLVDVSMDDMVHKKHACGPALANFISACVKAGKTLVISGGQGAGKTTWVRAVCSQIPPHEMIGTFETEFELHLHEMTDRHPIVHAWEHRPGSGEIGVQGEQAGRFTLEEAIHDSFRFNLDRQIVGEVRGPEVWPMLKAMESGPGSISTTHAKSAHDTVEKLVSCAMETGPQVTRELAVSKLAAAIDIVMYLHVEVVVDSDGTKRKPRWVQEVLVIEPSPDAVMGYSATSVFTPGPEGVAVASGKLSDRMCTDLSRHGFDLAAYNAESSIYDGTQVV